MARNVHIAKPTKEGAALKALREKNKITVREVARLTGRSSTLVTHLENGWNPVRTHHLEWLLPLYGVSKFQFDLMAKGEASSPDSLRIVAKELLQKIDEERIPLVHELLTILSHLNTSEVQS